MAKTIKTVTDLKSKLTTEKAMAFLKEANEKKVKDGVDLMSETMKKLDSMGLSVAVKNGLNQSNQITNDLQIVLKNGGQ